MDILKQLKISETNPGTSTGKSWMDSSSSVIGSFSPVDGKLIGSVGTTSKQDYETVIAKAQSAFVEWRLWPAPKRGEVVRQIGEALRKNKESLGRLVSYEMGKSLQEGYGEVQEMIDICDLAVGLSRQLHGLPCTVSALHTACTNSGTHWELLELFPLLISPLQYGAGIACWPGSAVMYVFGSRLKKRPYAELPASKLLQKFLKTIMFRKGSAD